MAKGDRRRGGCSNSVAWAAGETECVLALILEAMTLEA